MRLSAIFLPIALLAMSACTSVAPDRAPRLGIAFDASVNAGLAHENFSARRTSEIELAPGEAYVFRMDDLPVAAFDLGLMGSDARLDLDVSIMANRTEDDAVLYQVSLTTRGQGESHVIATPSLLVAHGETATVHLGQDGGEFQTGFTLDLRSLQTQ